MPSDDKRRAAAITLALFIGLRASAAAVGYPEVAASTAPVATTSAPPCTPKLAIIQGHRAAENCGPATLTLHVSGKTYTFRQGFCQQSKAANSDLEAARTWGAVCAAEQSSGVRPVARERWRYEAHVARLEAWRMRSGHRRLTVIDVR